jgi:hypothetical protein
LFYQQEELARVEEVKTDAILDGKKDTEVHEAETSAPKTYEEFIEETVAKCTCSCPPPPPPHPIL